MAMVGLRVSSPCHFSNLFQQLRVDNKENLKEFIRRRPTVYVSTLIAKMYKLRKQSVQRIQRGGISSSFWRK
jgi:hypothetical protein